MKCLSGNLTWKLKGNTLTRLLIRSIWCRGIHKSWINRKTARNLAIQKAANQESWDEAATSATDKAIANPVPMDSPHQVFEVQKQRWGLNWNLPALIIEEKALIDLFRVTTSMADRMKLLYKELHLISYI